VTVYNPPGTLGTGITIAGHPSHVRPTTGGLVSTSITVAGVPNYVQLLTGAGFEVRVYDVTNPNNGLLAVVPNPETVQFEDTLSDVGSGQVTVATDDLPAIVWQKDHIWKIFWEGVLRFAFIAEQVQDDSVMTDMVHRRTIAGKGVGQWLDKMKVYPTAIPTGPPQRTFNNVTYASIYQTLLNEAHARGTASFVTQNAWTATNDSEGAPWSDTNQLQVAVGTSMLDLLTQFSQALPFDWHVGPQFDLALTLQMGSDRSLQVMVQPVGSVIESTVTTDTTGLWDTILIQDANNQYTEQVDTTAIATYNRREQFVSSQTVTTSTGRADLAYSLLSQWKVPQVQRLVQVDCNTAGRKPFVDFGIGDFISVEFTDGSIVKSRVIAIAMAGGISVSEIAQVTLDFDIGRTLDAGTTTETSLGYTGPVTVYADNSTTTMSIGTTVVVAIVLQLVATTPTQLTCDTYVRGQASTNQTMTAQVYIDGNLIRTMKQFNDVGEVTWAPTFMIPSLDSGTHPVQLRLSVDTGTFAIAAFDLQHWYTGIGLEGGIPSGSTLLDVVDIIPALGPTITTSVSLVAAATSRTPSHTDTLSVYHTLTDAADGSINTLVLGYTRPVAAAGDDGATSSIPSFTNSATALEVGNDGGLIWGSYMRFTIPSPGLPAGGTITFATLTVMPTSTDSGLLSLVRAERAAGPAAPTTRADFLARTRTTASTAWNVNPTSGTSVVSPSLVPVIQEVLTAFGASITTIQLFIEDNTSPTNGKMLFQSFNHTTPVPAVLTIRYHA
jgi:hypothetical protein